MKLTSSKSWPDLCQQRYDWAEQSYTTFLGQFDTARLIQTANGASRQVSVIVYGPAQVGKTSFILTLLGVREERFTELNKLLRGGQTLGNMSTARSYRYRIAEDNGWYFSHVNHGQQSLDDDAAVAVFASLRQEVEQGRRVYDSIDVFIPQRFFNLENQASHHFLIRDLPGTHSKNKNEQHYVNHLASRYLSSADVVLLIGRVDALSFLQQEELGNPLLSDWYWHPHRYKVVLTRACSNATLRGMLEKSAPGKAELQKYLLKQINTMEQDLPDSVSQLIYPVECGHSWQAIVAADDDYSRQCRALRDEVLADLTVTLHQAANPLSRLRTGYALPQMIQQKIVAEQEDWGAEKARIRRQLQRHHAVRSRYQHLNDSTQSATEKLSIQLNECRDRWPGESADDLYQAFEQRLALLSETETLAYLNAIIADFRIFSSSVWREACIHHQLPIGAAPDGGHIRALEKHLKSYWVETYLFSSTFREDLSALLRACRADAGVLQEKIAHLLLVEKEQKIKDLEKLQRRLRHRARRISLVLTASEGKISALRQQEKWLTDEHDERISLYSDQLVKSKEFRSVISSAMQKRTQEITARISDPGINNSERLAWLLMQRMLNNDFKFVQSLGEEND